jgi:hypothetical protein
MKRIFRPPTGWHYIKCSKCGVKSSKMTHYGGTKELKACNWCDDHLCYECFKEDHETDKK